MMKKPCVFCKNDCSHDKTYHYINIGGIEKIKFRYICFDCFISIKIANHNK